MFFTHERCKGIRSGEDLLDTGAETIGHALLFPPPQDSPQVTTEPSILSAAKAYAVEKICLTPGLIRAALSLLITPPEELPQATTKPSLFSAANAVSVEKICLTPELRRSATLLLSPPEP